MAPALADEGEHAVLPGGGAEGAQPAPGGAAGAAALVAEYGIAPNPKVAEKAIPQCSLTYIAGPEMRNILENYYSILFQVEPKSIGGGLPYDSFYYGLS